VPTNLPPEARAKWARTLEARTPEEKLRSLQDFLSSIPQHKGTSKLRAHVKHQIALLRREIEERKQKKRGGEGGLGVKKEGAAQVVLLGYTKSGRSWILSKLTNAKPEVSSVPYTTREAIPGMMPYMDICFQLVEAPALRGDVELDAQVLSLARGADALMLVVDLSKDFVGQLSSMLKELQEAGINIEEPKGSVNIIKQKAGGIRVAISGRLVGCSTADVVKLVEGYGVKNALIRVNGEASLDDVEEALVRPSLYKPAIIIANKADLTRSEEKLKMLEAIKPKSTPLIPVFEASFNNDLIGSLLFKALRIIRVYTKEPCSEEPSKEPLILKEGSTVMDLAEKIHSGLSRNFKYAKLWSSNLPFKPVKVGASFRLNDGDVVEVHA